MKISLTASTLTLVLSTLAFAQDADPNTRAVLEAIQKLNGRLDTMQNDIDSLRKGATGKSIPQPISSENAGSQTTSQGVAATAGTERSISGQLAPGWVLNLFDDSKNDGIQDGDTPIATFLRSSNSFTTTMHEKVIQFANQRAFRAESIFHAKESGRHSFIARVVSYADCPEIKLDIDGNILFDTRLNKDQGYILQGNIEISSGYYKLKFDYACYSGRPMEILLQLKSPTDMMPRDFESNEILHVEKSSFPNAKLQQVQMMRNKLESVTEGVQSPLNIGAVREVVSSVNIRSQASVTSSLAGQLLPGQRVTVASVTPDQEWVTVAANGQVLGFIKMSAMHLNTK